MMLNDKENPFFEHYDRLLDICRNMMLHLVWGDGLRPEVYMIQQMHHNSGAFNTWELTKEHGKRCTSNDRGRDIPMHEITNMQIEKNYAIMHLSMY